MDVPHRLPYRLGVHHVQARADIRLHLVFVYAHGIKKLAQLLMHIVAELFLDVVSVLKHHKGMGRQAFQQRPHTLHSRFQNPAV